MCSTYNFNFINSTKFINYIPSKYKSSSSLTYSKSLNIYYLFKKPSGSDHIKSHIIPSWGTSYFLSMCLISSIEFISGDKPPCTQKKLLSIKAAKDIRSKISVQYFHTFKDPYFLRHSS